MPLERAFTCGAASLCFLWMTASCAPPAGPAADPELVHAIAGIPAFDHHAHPLRVVGDGETDGEWDALMPDLGVLEAAPEPLRARTTNPELIAAWRALYGYAHDDMSEAHVRELTETKRRLMREKGDAWPEWVLDRAGIGTMLANRVAMGRGLGPPRFLWVSYVDPLMIPLSNEAAKRSNPDYRAFYPSEERVLRRYLDAAGLRALPPALGEYERTVVLPTLERMKREGCIAVKFEAAYLRSLAFSEVSEAEAARVYARYARGGEPPAPAYKALQDHLFRLIAREAGRLGMAVHIHTGIGVGGHFSQTGADPLLLEPALDDPSLGKTTFVLVHGGWPYTRLLTALLAKPNVYVDFSLQALNSYPRELGGVLRGWLEFMPEKVLFGTDAFDATPVVSWEETAWLGAKTARDALALALTGMVRDGEISRERAVELARMVLRDNAAQLYRPPMR